MNIETLEKKCIESYGEELGKKLFEFMKKIHGMDFCVATGWGPNEISISRSCMCIGRIFKIGGDYETLILPNGEEMRIDNIGYEDIEKFLPRGGYGRMEQTHCEID
ncbi:MAG: hypothetical protein N3D20_03035 [Candidatus Pacearchaeota archaeon]|nr:hypothetical protein [Candidatus Pacearchaeota archaeon]